MLVNTRKTCFFENSYESGNLGVRSLVFHLWEHSESYILEVRSCKTREMSDILYI